MQTAAYRCSPTEKLVPAHAGKTQIMLATRNPGNKVYELSDHLGNVRATFADKRLASLDAGTSTYIDDYSVDVTSWSDYYAFGAQMPKRNDNPGDYRYGFNGMEKDDEVKDASGSSYDFGARMYDPRVGRWLTRDPLEAQYSGMSPYNFVGNMPIIAVDPDGREIKIVISGAVDKVNYLTLLAVLSEDAIFQAILAEAVESTNIYVIDVKPLENELGMYYHYNASLNPLGLYEISFYDDFGIDFNGPRGKVLEGLYGLSRATVYEEHFHLAQELFYGKDAYQGSMAMIEVEPKVAKLLYIYRNSTECDAWCDSRMNQLHTKMENEKFFGASAYEMEFLYGDDNSYNPVVKAYFDAVIAGENISAELEENFRNELKNFAIKVVTEGGYGDVDPSGYDGATPYFDQLIQQTDNNGGEE